MNSKLFLLLAFLAFVACKKEEDKCKSVSCYNDGVCLDGTCQCPPQWTGISCKDEVPPKTITLQSIRIDKFPSGVHNYYIYGESVDGITGRLSGTIYNVNQNNSEIFTLTKQPKSVNFPYFILVEELPNNDALPISDFNCTTYQVGTNFKTEFPLIPAGFVTTFEVSGISTSKFEW